MRCVPTRPPSFRCRVTGGRAVEQLGDIEQFRRAHVLVGQGVQDELVTPYPT